MNYYQKIITIMALILAICSSGSSAEDSQNKVFKPFIEHLNFLGYEVNIKGKKAVAEHPRWVNARIRQYKGGFVFTSFYYSCKQEAISSRMEFFESINKLNVEYTVARAIIDEEDEYCLVFAAWYPGPYNKKRFAIFLDSWNNDTSVLFYKDRQTLQRFIK